MNTAPGHRPSSLRGSLSGRPVPVGRPRRRVELVDPVTDGRWAAFVSRAEGADVAHHRAWLELLQSTYGCPVTACCLVDGSSTIVAGAPLALVPDRRGGRRLACLPFASACSPLPDARHDPVLAHELMLELDALRRRLGVPVELRGPAAWHPAAHVSATFYAHHLPLRTSVHAIDGAPSDGVTVERRTDARGLAELYRLRAAFCRRLGQPAPRRGFVLGFAHLFDRGLGFVLLARDRRQTLGGALLTAFNGTLRYEGGAPCGPAPSYAAHESLLRAAARWGTEAGMKTLELGRVDLDDASGRRLNLALGAHETRLEYTELRDDAPPRRRAAPRRWTAPIIRRSPVVVSRALGEAFYPVGA